MENYQWVDEDLQWVGNNFYQWGFGTTLQVWLDEQYVYAVTNEGIDIYDISSEEKYAYINYASGFTTVWGNDDKIFVGTATSGVKYINKTCISGSIITPYNISSCLSDLLNLTSYYNLTSDNIKYIHGYEDKLGVITNSGIDIVKLEPQSYRSYTLVSGAQKCFVTSNRFYYTISGTSSWVFNILYTCLVDWSSPSKSYTTGSGIFDSGIKLTDIFITEETTSNGYNTIFTTTSSGVYVINEYTDEYDIYFIEGS